MNKWSHLNCDALHKADQNLLFALLGKKMALYHVTISVSLSILSV